MNNIQKIVQLRKELHKYPEVSGKEEKTAERIIRFFDENCAPTKTITNIGGHGIVFEFDSGNPGKSVLFRSELDALPIDEVNTFDYRSKIEGVSHKCGHDGHASILAYLGVMLSENKLKKGKVYLLYQPAEETGEGAAKMLADEKMKSITPDYVFALHNLPGFERGAIVLKKNVFASASAGVIINLDGKTSHAAEPEKGINPAYTVGSILKFTENYKGSIDKKQKLKLITPVGIIVGKGAFGTSAGHAELKFTIRAAENKDFEDIKNALENETVKNASEYKLKRTIDYTEVFPSTKNNTACIEMTKQAANRIKSELIEIDAPFKWSEDFGHFTSAYKGALFGLGAGIEHPAIHNPDYDFPDELLEKGASVFYEIAKIVCNE